MPVLTVFFFQVTYIKAKHHSKRKLWCYDIVSNPRPISSSLVVLDKGADHYETPSIACNGK